MHVYYIARSLGCWGSGPTITEAEKNLFKAGGNRKDYFVNKITWDSAKANISEHELKLANNNLYTATLPYVDDYGNLCCFGEHEVVKTVSK